MITLCFPDDGTRAEFNTLPEAIFRIATILRTHLFLVNGTTKHFWKSVSHNLNPFAPRFFIMENNTILDYQKIFVSADEVRAVGDIYIPQAEFPFIKNHYNPLYDCSLTPERKQIISSLENDVQASNGSEQAHNALEKQLTTFLVEDLQATGTTKKDYERYHDQYVYAFDALIARLGERLGIHLDDEYAWTRTITHQSGIRTMSPGLFGMFVMYTLEHGGWLPIIGDDTRPVVDDILAAKNDPDAIYHEISEWQTLYETPSERSTL